MHSLTAQIKKLQDSPINKLVEDRLTEFESFKNKSDTEWFSELCFCILAANSKQKTAENIQKSLNSKLLTISQQDLADYIKNNKHRFHNNKASYIVEARQHHPIKSKLNGDEISNRTWLVKNIKGIGMKEASHFLRNTGSKNLAILDRHILRTMQESSIIPEVPKSLPPKLYLSIESKFNSLAKELNISPAKLDLFIWYLRNGEIAK
ncbi:N-glycosylase [Candidatus Pacearchaeota archaeon CG10_big_fil_rev_8_21_14_0_10_34_76]|nr:MAG: N-glycosylase [Candidatus Pacearchaeota archaeon CG10_big_fil_rev_8_21_14_0_10_34_76]